MGAISNVLGYLLNWLYEFLGNYGLAIIVFSAIIRIILIPITIKQQKTMKKSSELQEKTKVLQVKYKNNQEELNKATMELYKQENFNPMSGCLSGIIQLIIILSVFWLVSKPLTYMKKIDSDKINNYIQEITTEDTTRAAYSEISVIQKKSAEDSDVYINMDFAGIDLSKVPGQNMGDWTVFIIPVLYVASTFISMKINTVLQSKKTKILNEKNEQIKVEDSKNDEEENPMESMQQMSKSMTYMFPIMSIPIVVLAPLGLSLYWLISNIFMIIERLVVNKIYA